MACLLARVTESAVKVTSKSCSNGVSLDKILLSTHGELGFDLPLFDERPYMRKLVLTSRSFVDVHVDCMVVALGKSCKFTVQRLQEMERPRCYKRRSAPLNVNSVARWLKVTTKHCQVIGFGWTCKGLRCPRQSVFSVTIRLLYRPCPSFAERASSAVWPV